MVTIKFNFPPPIKLSAFDNQTVFGIFRMGDSKGAAKGLMIFKSYQSIVYLIETNTLCKPRDEHGIARISYRKGLGSSFWPWIFASRLYARRILGTENNIIAISLDQIHITLNYNECFIC